MNPRLPSPCSSSIAHRRIGRRAGTVWRLLAAVIGCTGLIAAAGPAPGAGPVLLDDVAVRLEPCDGFPWVEPGTAGKVGFVFDNRGRERLELHWRCNLVLPDGREHRLVERLVLEPAEKRRLAVTDEAASRRGVARFDWELRDQSGRRLALSDLLAVLKLPGPDPSHRDEFRFGWGTSLVHFVETREDAAVMRAYASMGCDLVRVGDMWAYSSHNGDAATANANNRYWSNTEKVVDAARAAGMDVLYVMWGTPPNLVRAEFSHRQDVPGWAEATGTKPDLMTRVSPPALGAWKRRVRDTVDRFKDRVAYWEVWNDQDRYHDNGHHMPNGWVGDTDEYIELLRTASHEIRAIDPELKILSGGFYTLGADPRRDANPDMQARVLREAQTAFDIHASFDVGPRILLGPMADLRKSLHPPKPLWITRVEQKGATPEELVRRLLSVKGCDARAFVWMWALNFDSGSRGLLMPMDSWKTPDRRPLNRHSFFQVQPAGAAYIHAIGLLRGTTPTGRLDTGTPGQWLFGFTVKGADPRRDIVGLWQDKNRDDASVRLCVGTSARAVLLDVFGNERPLPPAVDGVIDVPVRHTPVYLVVTGGGGVSVAPDRR